LHVRATLETSLVSQISSASVLFLHLVVIGYDATGGPFHLVRQFLAPYFPFGGFEYHEVHFDVGNESKVEKYQASANKLLKSLLAKGTWTRVVIAMTNHTNNDLGDLYLGYEGKTKEYVA